MQKIEVSRARAGWTPSKTPGTGEDPMRDCAERVIACYMALASAQQHLLDPLLAGATPVQWAHYPDDDVVDEACGYQYFYHSHSPQDRPHASDHGHFHLFARSAAHLDKIDPAHEARFLRGIKAAPAVDAKTAALLCIGLDAKGVPISLFTVNRWVTGDHLLSADATLALLDEFRLNDSGPASINAWLKAMIGLFWPQIVDLVRRRDRQLAALCASGKHGGDILDDPGIELLSNLDIDIDQQLRRASRRGILRQR
ncbi:MAG: hypothetical protein V4582_00525 [Pseudomonadota bacterium]